MSSTSIVSSVEDEVSRITFPHALPVGAATLSITFTGVLNDQMKGDVPFAMSRAACNMCMPCAE